MTAPLKLSIRHYPPAACADVEALLGRPPTRGRVGLALSGGGTRAAVVATGILRTLDAWGLLPHIRVVSAVSGAAWATVPFTYLPPRFDRAAFLGRYEPDPSALDGGPRAGAAAIDRVDPADGLYPYTRLGMSSLALSAKAIGGRLQRIESRRLWIRLISEQVLTHWGLADFDEAHRARSFFAADAEAAAALRAACPGLPDTVHLVRPDVAPLMVTQAAMRVVGADGEPTLAPLTITPRYAGVIGHGIGTLDGRAVGGGAFDAVAFGGRWIDGPAHRPTVELAEPLSLAAVTGIASVFYGDALADRGIELLNPAALYFAPGWQPPAGHEAQMIDAGAVECSGIAGLLAFDEVDAIIAAVSPPTALKSDGPDVVVDRQIAALFGYREYDEKTGWRRYDEPGGGNPDYGHSQVFPSEDFPPLVEALGARHRAGDAAIVAATHRVLDNPRFAVRGGRTVRVVWSVLAESRIWSKRLRPPVRLHQGPSFPNISTMFTALPTPTCQLLAHYAGWMLGRERGAIEALFGPA